MSGSESVFSLSWFGRLPGGVEDLDVPDATAFVDGDSVSVAVLARDPGRILIFDEAGQFLREIGSNLLSSRPHGVTAGQNGVLWVADDFGHAVFGLTPQGELQLTIGTPGIPSPSGVKPIGSPLAERAWSVNSDVGPFNQPTKVAVAPDGDLYVSDGYGNARIHRFDRDGNRLASFGGPGAASGEFNLPHWIIVDQAGELLVADRENDRVQVFRGDGSHVRDIDGFHRPASIIEITVGRYIVAEIGWRDQEVSARTRTGVAARPSRLVVVEDSAISGYLTRTGDVVPERARPGLDYLVGIHGLGPSPRGGVLLAAARRKGASGPEQGGAVLELSPAG